MPKSTKKTRRIYLDYAASVSANPSSSHSAGVEAKRKMERARREVANFLGARTTEIIFTSGGTESNNLAIQGVVLAWLKNNKKNKSEKILPHILTTNIEHPSVLETFKMLEKRKLAQISIVPVETSGLVDPKKIKKEIRKNTILISVMLANNEIGVIQPIKEIAREIRRWKKGYPYSKNFIWPIFHTDAVQAVNYLDLNVEKLGVDLLSLSGSKIKGAGRIGVLYKRKSAPLANIFGGGDQEMGLRPGTENWPAIVQFSEALKLAQKIKNKEVVRLTKLRDYFFEKIKTMSKGTFDIKVLINGDLKNRLPNNVNVSFPKIPSELLVIELSERGIMASAKSACQSSRSGGSTVIKAIHPELAGEIGGVRFSLGRETTKSDIDYTVKALAEILIKLKKWYTPTPIGNHLEI